jgi:hypothetical protein
MYAPVAAVETQLITDAKERARTLLRTLSVIQELSVDAACERVALAVERYYADLLDELVASVFSADGPDSTPWLRQRYAELVLDFATSIRSLEANAVRRHAIAQVLQNKVLESERRLRSVLNVLGPLTLPDDTTDVSLPARVSSRNGQ